jgi:AMP-polyphosphate phosphotransferase
MFESAALPHVLDKVAYKAEEPALREALLDVQFDLRERRSFPVLILIAGADGAGKGEAIQKLYEWLDPRHLRTRAYGEPNDEERTRPRMWRYWRDLPPKGDIGVVFGSWYNDPLRAFVLDEIDELAFERELDRINHFELMLAHEGTLVLKLWFHVAADVQKRRLKKVKRDPAASRHVLEEWSGVAHHARLVRAGERLASLTSTGFAPWVVIPSGDDRYRDMTMGRIIEKAVRRRLDGGGAAPTPDAPALISAPGLRTALDGLDLTRTVTKPEYEKELRAYQDRLAMLTDSRAFRDQIGLVVAFEGTDAAGKGGSIRRVTQALDPRRFAVHPIAAPTEEEKAKPYLWRFWRRLPRKGTVAIFDRTWYGRVLVERVEGYCTEAEWLRAYSEINDFEDQLHDFGFVVIKFWLAISKEEQARRFEARRDVPYKRYKITDEDWRNREKWDEYVQAVGDMVDRTSTDYAPWTLVEAEDKRYGRLKVLRTICKRLEARLT